MRKTLSDIRLILHREYGFWVKKNPIVVRALQFYLGYLKDNCKNTEDELVELLKNTNRLKEVEIDS